jgi:hypothetical protein
MLNFHNDDNIKILYDRKVDADYQELEAIGATESLTLRELGFTPDNTNSIFVSKDGNNSNAGTQVSPVLTIERANALLTASKSNIIIVDSGEYEENPFDLNTNCSGIFSAIGKTPTLRPIVKLKDALTAKATNANCMDGPHLQNKGEARPLALSDGTVMLIWQTGWSTDMFLLYRKLNPNGELGPLTTRASSHVDDLTPYTGDGFFTMVGRSVQQGLGIPQNRLQIKMFSNNGSLIHSSYAQPMPNGLASACKFSEFTMAIGWRYATGVVGFMVKSSSGTDVISPRTVSGVEGYYRGMIYNSAEDGVFLLTSTDFNTTIYVRKIDANGYLHPTILTSFSSGNIHVFNSDPDHFYMTQRSGNTLQYKKWKIATWELITPDWVNIITLTPVDQYDIFYVRDRTVEGGFVVSHRRLYTNYSFHITNSDLNGTVYSFISPTGNPSYPEYESICYNPRTGMCVAFGVSQKAGISGSGVPWKVSYTYIPVYLKNFITVENNTSLELNGIKFKGTSGVGFLCNYFNIKSTVAALKIKWCDFHKLNEKSIAVPESNFDLFTDETITRTVPILSSATSNTVENSIIHNNFRGLEFVCNNVEALRSIFHANGWSPGIAVKGAGENIKINHCDFLYNKTGVYLEDNAGDEIIRNSTFFKNINADIEAETPVELNHSLFTGVLINCTLGTKVLQVNPLYINDGFNDITKINLNLKRKLLGFLIDSAGLGLADDGGDAGSHKTVILGVEETWKEIKVPKGEMKRKFGPAWAVSNIFDSGRMKSQKKGMVETIEIDWSKGLRSEFVDKIIQLNTCDSSEVRLYPDPATHPLDYGTYTFEYQEIDLDPGTNRLSNRGYKGVKMIFKRSVEDMVI